MSCSDFLLYLYLRRCVISLVDASRRVSWEKRVSTLLQWLAFDFDIHDCIMDPSSSKSQQEPDKARLRKEKQWFRNNIAVAVAEEDDPLSAYEQYTNWLIEHENPNQREINYESSRV